MRAARVLLSFAALGAACGSLRGSGPLEPVRPREPFLPVADLTGRILVVDAGHGGRDPGAVAVDGTHEKDVAFAISRALVAELVAAGATVHETRRSDAYVALEDRAELARSTGCDLLVSVHADAAERPGARGATVFVAPSALVASVRAAEAIAGKLARAGGETRGVKRAPFLVLVGHPRPSVLVECGFLTNDEERAALLDPEVQRRIARAIASGVGEVLGADR